MLVPTAANYVNFFYAIGNTPALSLIRHVPHGVNADVLLLGCGDVRNILYTAYTEDGLPTRRLDITCCDYDESLITRNIVLFTLLFDGSVDINALWDIYYHLYLDAHTTAALERQLKSLERLSESIDMWKAGPYGAFIQFCDDGSFQLFRKELASYTSVLLPEKRKEFYQSFSVHLKESEMIRLEKLGTGTGTVITGVRSAAPLATQAVEEMPQVFDHYWKHGTIDARKLDTACPNPLIAAPLSAHKVFHYGADPTFGFHLATAFAKLARLSPLQPDTTKQSTSFKAVAAATNQFNSWATSFRKLAPNYLTLRFVVADALAFSHTLQHSMAKPADESANWYRRHWDFDQLKLDAVVYGEKGTAPKSFDAIDTSNLADHLGTLNLLTAASPLLKANLWATLSTESLLQREKNGREAFNQLLLGDAPTISILLGVSPLEYWTNTTTISSVDEFMLGVIQKAASTQQRQVHSRLTWKQDGYSLHEPRALALSIQPQALTRIIHQIYEHMFAGESLANLTKNINSLQQFIANHTYPHFHRGTLASVLSFLRKRLPAMDDIWEPLVNLLSADKSLQFSSNFIQELAINLHMQGLYTDRYLLEDLYRGLKTKRFSNWETLPSVVAITLVVPRGQVDRLYETFENKFNAPIVQCNLSRDATSSEGWVNMFADVHIAFGHIVGVKGQKRHSDGSVILEQDPAGWDGTSPLIASFYAPTSTLLQGGGETEISLNITATIANTLRYSKLLGPHLTVFKTLLDNEHHVFVSRYMPNHSGYRSTGAAVGMVSSTRNEILKVTANVDDAKCKIISFTSRVEITSPEGKALLISKAPIELRQASPFRIDIAFGKDKFILPLNFPSPVAREASKIRIARTSGYIEVMALVAEPTRALALDDFIFPTFLPMTPQFGSPATANIPHLNLDALPIVDVSDRAALRWLTTLASCQFSAREKALRGTTSTAGLSPLTNPRLNFKESLFTIFMLSSGLQGQQTGLFALNHPSRGGVHALLLVSALRLDPASASVVLDAAAIPLTTKIMETGDLQEFLLILQGTAPCLLTVDDAELALWKRTLPALAERCRTWSHKPTCEYRRPGATIPLSVEPGAPVLCACGAGELPDDFIALPGWGEAAARATRVAISPVFAAGVVEAGFLAEELGRKGVAAEQPRTVEELRRERCAGCGKTEASDGKLLKKCGRCRMVSYCGAKCQRDDWKRHKRECATAEEFEDA